MKTAIVATDEKVNDRVPDPDVLIILQKGNRIVNGTGGVMNGLIPKLGKGKLGFMKLGA